MFYDNQSYWTNLHEKFRGEFKAVGHPFLSESMNRLKYESETQTFLVALEKITSAFKQMNRMKLSLLDVGAGYGYWTALTYELLTHNGFEVNASALDMSTEALGVLKERFPYVHPVCADLKTITPDHDQETYDFVFACYCLHHLTRARDFLNALQFTAESVKMDGFLLIMDPVLTMPFSKSDTLDFQSFHGNGIPRHLYFVDDVLNGFGLKRCLVLPAVSFILNQNIEALDKLSYYTMMLIWKFLCRLDQIENFVRKSAGAFKYIDSVLKHRRLAFSSSVCIYQKLILRNLCPVPFNINL